MNAQGKLQDLLSSFVDLDLTMPTLILRYLDSHTEVTFIDLEADVPGFSGNLLLKSSSNPDTALWRGVSRCAMQGLRELEKKDVIHYKETSFRVYQSKAKKLPLSIADWGSQVLHWTPVFVELRSPDMITGDQEVQEAGMRTETGLRAAPSLRNS